MARRNGLVDFIAGFGTGFMSQQAKSREQARQDELDQRVRTEYDQKQEDRQKQEATEQQLKDAVAPTYGSNQAVTAGALQSAAPEVFQDDTNADGTPGMAGVDKAQHFIDNSTPQQASSYLNSYVKQGITTMGDQTPNVDSTSGKLQLGDNATKQELPLWQKLTKQAEILGSTGKVDDMRLAVEAIKTAGAQHSEELQKQVQAAAAGGVNGMLKAYSEADNSLAPHTDLTYKETPTGWDVIGTPAAGGEPEKLGSFDKNAGSLESQLYGELMKRTSPAAMTQYYAQQLNTQMENRKLGQKDTEIQQTGDAHKETARHNQAEEDHTATVTAETVRHNGVDERIAQGHLDVARNTAKNKDGGLNLEEHAKLNKSVDDTAQLVGQALEQGGMKVLKTKTSVPIPGQFTPDGQPVMREEGLYQVTPDLRQQIHTLTMNGIEQPEIVRLLGKRDAKGNATSVVYVPNPNGAGKIKAIKTSKGYLPLQ